MPDHHALICPECGHDTFTVTRTTRTTFTVQYDTLAGEYELSSECVDGGDSGDENDLTCEGCGESFDDCNPDEDLTTPEAFNYDGLSCERCGEESATLCECPERED